MPTDSKDTDSQPQDVKSSSTRLQGRFLTARDRALILEGPEPKRKTKLLYRGKRVDADRRAHKVAYARVLREAKRDAMGALEDLAFLAQHLKPDWVYDVVTETRPLHPPTEDEVPSEEARQLMGLMGRRPYAPMEDFLRSVLRKVAWEKWPDEEDAHRPRKGAFVVVRLAAAMEEGLNPEDGHPTHVVQVVTRQDPAGQIKVWGYPEPRRPGDDKMGGIPRSPFG